MEIRKAYSIGFTKRTAEEFFGVLKKSEIKQLIDIRLNNVSQLAGFTKRDDLKYFLTVICSASYRHEVLLAPTQEILDDYKKKRISWLDYEKLYLKLLESRRVEAVLPQTIFDTPTVLLCSEPTAEKCHRRLALEYLQQKWGNFVVSQVNLNIIHL